MIKTTAVAVAAIVLITILGVNADVIVTAVTTTTAVATIVPFLLYHLLFLPIFTRRNQRQQ